MQRCPDTKRHKTASRGAAGLLIVMLWLQISLRVTQAATTKNQADVQDIQAANQKDAHTSKNIQHTQEIVHLLTARKDGKIISDVQKDGTYIWWIRHTRSNFKLVDNDTALVVPQKGLYLVNLKMSYKIPASHYCTQILLWLKTEIQQYHSSYPMWIKVINSEDSMHCEHHWHQSVTLSQVVRLKKGTKLRVIIEAKNYAFIIGDESTYLNVTLL